MVVVVVNAGPRVAAVTVGVVCPKSTKSGTVATKCASKKAVEVKWKVVLIH